MMVSRIATRTSFPKLANVFNVSSLSAARIRPTGRVLGRSEEKFFSSARQDRSKTWFPIAVPGRGLGFTVVEKIPKGMFATVKSVLSGISIWIVMIYQ